MKFHKIYLLTLLLFLSTITAQENNVEGLKITFRKVSEDYMEATPYYIGNRLTAVPLEALEGMKLVKLKLTLKNEGQKIVNSIFQMFTFRPKKTVYIVLQCICPIRKTQL